MPKFLVTNGSYFQPFTYDEMVKPLAQMAEAQNAAQDAYDVLGMETAALEGYLTENEDDAEARALYNNYRSRLEALQNNLWGNGYTPQTRRDLALARTGYAQDIKGKLQNNIERRQAQSKAYWDMKHANPDMVMGRDPGSFGLDNYIHDPNFGNDWYSYNGKEFRSSVAAEVKARASELKKHLDITSDPRLAGVLTRWESGGFTNAETLEAGSVVDNVINLPESERYRYYKEHKIGDEIIILSESLINQYDATGARNADMDGSERSRLLNYGKTGWAEGVLGTTTKDFDDKVYDEQREMRKMAKQFSYDVQKMNEQARLNRENMVWESMVKGGSSGSGGGSGSGDKPGSVNMGTTAQLTTPGYENLVKSTSKQAEYYRKAPNGIISVVGPDGNGGQKKYDANNEFDMADIVYGTEGREQIRKAFGGYDIALAPGDNANNGQVVWEGQNGDKFNLVVSRATPRDIATLGLGEYGKDALVVRFSDDGTVWGAATDLLNKETKALNERVAEFKSNDPDIDKKLVTPKQQRKLRESDDFKEYDIRAPWSGFHDYANSKSYTARRTAVSITGYEHYNDKARQSMGSALATTYRGNQNMGKDSPYAIHVVGPNNLSFSEGVTDYGVALGRDKDGNLLNDTVTDVHAFLEDLARGSGGFHDGSSPMVRFQTSKSNNTFATSPLSFGSTAYNVLNGRSDYIAVPEIGSPVEQYTLTQEIALCLLPILERDFVNSMSEQESRDWGWRAYKMIGSDFPSIKNSGGEKFRPMSAKEVASNPQAKDKIYQLVWDNLGEKAMRRFLDAINK